MNRPEHQLLLACARIGPDSEQSQWIRSCICKSIDWTYLLQTARAHMMTSQLYRHLHANCPDAVPQPILADLHRHFSKSARSNLLFTAELIKILDLFNKNHVRAIPLKGPVLSQSLYENPALREFGDLDLIVEKQVAFKALGLLQALGYPKIPEYPARTQSRILEHKNHYLIVKADTRIIVELHWRLLPPHYLWHIPTDNWWKRAERIPFEGRSILTLSAEDLLAVLCIHGCKHLWRSLSWLADIVRLLDANPALCWDYIFSEYAHQDLKRMIFLSLIAAHNLLNAKLPDHVLQTAMKDPVALQLARRSEDKLFSHKRITESLSFLRFQTKLRSSWTDRIRFCYRLTVAPVMLGPDVFLPRFLIPFHQAASRLRDFRFRRSRRVLFII